MVKGGKVEISKKEKDTRKKILGGGLRNGTAVRYGPQAGGKKRK